MAKFIGEETKGRREKLNYLNVFELEREMLLSCMITMVLIR